MHLSINITALSYDGNNYLTYSAIVTRSENDIYTITDDTIQFGQPEGDITPFNDSNNAFLYRRLCERCYYLFCTALELTAVPVTYVVLGLAINGPFKIIETSKFIAND